MMKAACLPVFFALASVPQVALAAEVSDSGALALAAIVGELSPAVSDADKQVLAKLLDGDTGFQSKKGLKIAVLASAIKCHTSNVDLTAHDCALTFEGNDKTLQGRAAHELLATLAEEGVEADPGAGNVWYALSKLDCTIDVDEIKDKAGGGVSCTFGPYN